MSVTLKLHQAFRARRPALRWSSSALRTTAQWRTYSSTPADDTLPLKGVRVLDMTRVLAGVRISDPGFLYYFYITVGVLVLTMI